MFPKGIKCEALGAQKYLGVQKVVEHSFELMLNPLSPESHCGHLFKDDHLLVLPKMVIYSKEFSLKLDF